MNAFPVVLDACVLFNRPVSDTLLRAAEKGLYRVRWSNEILIETQRNLVAKGRCSPKQATHLLDELRNAFPEATITVPPDLVLQMTNHVKDRHVTAAAVAARAPVIVTFNLKDFPGEALESWNLEAQHPDTNLMQLWSLSPQVMTAIIEEQASDLRGFNVPKLLCTLAKHVPTFASEVGKVL